MNVVSTILLVMLSGCLRKKTPEELLKTADEKYNAQKYKDAVQTLEQFDNKYPFHENYIDAIILLVHSKNKINKATFRANVANEKIVRLCDEIIAQNTKKAFVNDIMTIRIEAQYRLCIHNVQYSNKLFVNTMALITKYFDYISELYHLKVTAKSRITAMQDVITKVYSLPRLPDSPTSLKLDEMLAIYKQCEKYLVRKRKAIIQYYLKRGHTAAALAESSSLIQNTELLELKPELIKERIILLLESYGTDLNSNQNDVTNIGGAMVDSILELLREMDRYGSTSKLTQEVMIPLKRFITKFNLKLSSKRLTELERYR